MRGDLFGATQSGGSSGDGTVFEIPYVDGQYATTPITLVDFNGANGASPSAGLTFDSKGDLFGTTVNGGTSNYGTVFEISYVKGQYTAPTTLVSFDGTNGIFPHASVIIDASGDLFGTTAAGGPGGFESGEGTVFEVPYSGGAYASTPLTVAAFNLTDGAIPFGGLTSDANGNLFGTTEQGGASNEGTAFEVTASGFVPFCFLVGTQIATPTGEVAVENLVVGNLVMTFKGEARRIVWIGKGRALATRGSRTAATPVIVRRGALADNVPHRDLRITKAHSLYLDGVLIPVEFLVNHRSIVWDDYAQEVTIYHIELETHDVLLANGAPAESYRDDGNRWLFQNANSGWDLPPQEPCASVLTDGPVVDTVWRRLLERAEPRPRLPTTEEPDLHLFIDGRRVDGKALADSICMFRLPERPGSVRIVSRAGAPDVLGIARDPRLLGVAVRQIRLWRGARLRLIEAYDPSLDEGFHLFEEDNGFRWTDGNARLPAALFDGINGPCDLELSVGGTTRYPLCGEPVRAAAA
jgi:uncharacterized repeat protein (TIGR03803 family)